MDADLAHQLLDLLVDGPSSGAALYRSLLRNYGHGAKIPTAEYLDALEGLERQRWIRVRQMTGDGTYREPSSEERLLARTAYGNGAGLSATDPSVDEVGMWYELTPSGRHEWERWEDNMLGAHRNPWTLDDSSENQTIVVCAKTRTAAESALSEWLSSNPGLRVLSDTLSIEPVSEFILKNGEVVRQGVRLACRYERDR